jgi:enoyl-CoA hydratase
MSGGIAQQFPDLRFEGPDGDGVLQLVLDRPGRKNAVSAAMHGQLGAVWPQLEQEADVAAVLVRGADDAFSAGGDFELLQAMVNDEKVRIRTLEETRAILVNMVGFTKPVVSAINGAAVGAGLAVALLADISIAGEAARLTDGHVRIGLAAGDHAALLWPLLCGMAKAKRYLLLPEMIDGREAERIGLVSQCVPDAELLPRAEDVARRLALSSPTAIRWTKRSMNGWLQQALPIFDTSVALEFLGLAGAEAREGVQALKEKRPPNFRGGQA